MLIMPSGDRFNCVVKYILVKLFVPRQTPPSGCRRKSYLQQSRLRVEALANMFVFQNWWIRCIADAVRTRFEQSVLLYSLKKGVKSQKK